jgi:N utilization substance protein A
LSLAIGKKGQNVRLASRLAGWEIDIVSEAEAAVLSTVESVEIDFHDVEGIEPGTVEALEGIGVRTLRDIFNLGEEGLAEIEGIDAAAATAIHGYASDVYGRLAEEAMARARAGVGQEKPPTPREILESMIPDIEGEAAPEEASAATPTPDAPPTDDEEAAVEETVEETEEPETDDNRTTPADA